MNCMKLLDLRLATRDFDRQTAELQVRIAILNRFTALGAPPADIRRGRGSQAFRCFV